MGRQKPTRGRTAVWLFLLFVLVAATTLTVDAFVVPAETAPAPREPAGPVRDAEILRADHMAPSELHRIPVVTEPPAAEASARPFPELVDEIARTAQRTGELVAADEIEEARRNDEAARAGFEALMDAYPDAGEQALAMLAAIPPGSQEAMDLARRTVLQIVLDTTLRARHELADAAEDRSRVDPLVESLLTVMHFGGATASLGEALLVDRPFLRLYHEPAVLAIVEMAGQDEFDRGLATRLLLTLWKNLQAFGERSSGDLASMAMLLMADADPSKRTAACRHLLLDERYRSVVLAWLREHQDFAVTADVSTIAAQELPPRGAVLALRELSSVLTNLPGAYLLLATRAEEVVAEEYYHLLGSGTHPEVRRDLVCGMGMAQGPGALELIEHAQTDPSKAVRAQAVLTLSVLAPEQAEEALGRLLDDPRTQDDPDLLHTAVLVVDNLASASLLHAVDRLGQRLRQTPLGELSRQRLEGILARCLPGGRTSR